MTLQENDLVLTGTPEGVGPVKQGDVRGRGSGAAGAPCIAPLPPSDPS